ncbi:MAG: hypothetical protein BWY28_03239 [bacterium ADurb.Bin236]|nr:MAG: hypothetical protein BWY28_03239 [bacterium ADurb.Bin236]
MSSPIISDGYCDSTSSFTTFSHRPAMNCSHNPPSNVSGFGGFGIDCPALRYARIMR